MNPKLSALLLEGFSINTLEKLTNSQLEILHEKVKKSKEVKEQPKPVEKTVTSKVIELPSGSKKAVGNITVSNDGGKTIITQTAEGEVTEKSVSRSQQGLMGAAYSVKTGKKKLKDISPKYRKKVEGMLKMTKKDLKDFASTKHKNLPDSVNDSEVKDLEESIMNIINDYNRPTITKSKLIKTINRFKQ